MTQSDYRVPMRAGLAIEAHASEPAYVGLAAACRIAAAEEFRALVAEATSLGTAAQHYLSADVLIARAAYLDPEGAR